MKRRKKVKFALILTSCPKTKAKVLALALLKSRLVACAQISSGITSHYRWQGKLEKTPEVQIWLKARLKDFNKIQQKIHRIHPYQVPEILCIPIDDGSKDYLQWLQTETAR